MKLPGILQDKVVLVTGASRGIGRSAVRLLASQGAKVAINYFNSDEHALMVKEIIEEDGGWLRFSRQIPPTRIRSKH